ncbi:MAG TPA: fatty acid oxidation complex subunit alpha FadB [Solimonas sp.]
MSDLMFSGQALAVRRLPSAFAELCFDRAGASVNTLDALALDELRQAVEALHAESGLRGLLISSAKPDFIVGADIFEFTALFSKTEDEIARHNAAQSAVLTALEDLPFLSVAAIPGMALGGGLELALCADSRVLATDGQLGLPEVNLGIFPGLGGTVRLPRLAGVAAALDWIVSGKPRKADAARDEGVVDLLAPSAGLREAALARLQELAAGDSWQALRVTRHGAATGLEAATIEPLRARLAPQARHLPAALAAVELVAASAPLDRDAALSAESRAFARIARTPAAAALVQIFLNDQALKKQGRAYAKAAAPLRQAAVLGAGIMGGGIAYTSAVRGVPVLLKDIAAPALELGQKEAAQLLARQVTAGRMDEAKARAVQEAIVLTLDYAAFGRVDIVVEAIVENLGVKQRVLAEMERELGDEAIIVSNTSSLSIAEIGSALARPQRFAGMHFFNPVPVMPLVEVIRGPQTDERTIATVAHYAATMGKTPVVVSDCAGFLVNRILTAYFVGFLMLLRDGGDIAQIDRVMEDFGWPMGPAVLQDVIGMDTSRHVVDCITAAYPQRMALDFRYAIAHLAELGRYGQKNGKGFYRYQADERGRLRREADPELESLLAPIRRQAPRAFDPAEIVDRLMLPMVVEAATCLEEGVVQTAAEVDSSLVLGVGFPRHWGGALKYADLVGLPDIVARCGQYRHLGGGYRATPGMQALAQRGAAFHAGNAA